MACYDLWKWYVLIGWAGLGVSLLLFLAAVYLWDGED